MKQTLQKYKHYWIMNKLAHLGCSLFMIIASAYPLFDLIRALGDVKHEVSVLTIGLILVWLVSALLGSLLWFYFTWVEITDDEEK